MMKTKIISLLIGSIGFTTFTVLLWKGKIVTLGYCVLLAGLALLCLVIPVLDRLKELDLRKLKFTLERMEEVKKDIYAKEDSLKAASLALAELIAADVTLSSIWGDHETDAYRKQLIRAKLSNLSSTLKFTPSEINQIFKYEHAFAEVLSAPKEEQEVKWKQFLKSETEKND